MGDVVDHGADPSGKRDSRPAIEAAITAAADGEGVVYFPAGSYRMSRVRPQPSASIEDEANGGPVEAD